MRNDKAWRAWECSFAKPAMLAEGTMIDNKLGCDLDTSVSVTISRPVRRQVLTD
jgi:hypothetical protein